MSKVRINDLAKELEVKSRAILDILPELGVVEGKTHSSSLELDEAVKVRAHFAHSSRPASHASASPSRTAQTIVPKIDLSHISKPGDVLKAIQAKKKEEEEEARRSHLPAKAATPPIAAMPVVRTVPAAPVTTTAATAPARPEPRRIVPAPRSAPPIVAMPPAAPAIASRPPSGPIVAKAPAGAVPAGRTVVVVAPPPASVVVKPQWLRPRAKKSPL
jgi:translation initiation factor IF-2